MAAADIVNWRRGDQQKFQTKKESRMQRAKGRRKLQFHIFVKFAAAALLLGGIGTIPSLCQQKGQKTFSSAEEASKALFNATNASDEKALLEFLRGSKRWI